MHVFVSWSGTKSHEVAKVFQTYLPSIINEVVPWLSSKDIGTGASWSREIGSNLELSNIGIVCLTAENQHAPWINFEAGAIAKLTTVGKAMVLRIDLESTDVEGPLGQFQSVPLDKDGVWKLVSDINQASGKEPVVSGDTLRRTFDALWPSMEMEFDRIRAQVASPAKARRTSESMLEELLELNRMQDSHLDLVSARLEATVRNLFEKLEVLRRTEDAIHNSDRLVKMMAAGSSDWRKALEPKEPSPKSIFQQLEEVKQMITDLRLEPLSAPSEPEPDPKD